MIRRGGIIAAILLLAACAQPRAAPHTAIGLAMARNGDRVYAALGRANHVAEVDPKTFALRRYFKAGARDRGIALSPDETRLYAANGLSGDGAVIDLKSGRTLKSVKVGGKPWGVVTAR